MKEFNEGDPCPFEGCEGSLVFPRSEKCTCNILPPCEACCAQELICERCGEYPEDGFGDLKGELS